MKCINIINNTTIGAAGHPPNRCLILMFINMQYLVGLTHTVHTRGIRAVGVLCPVCSARPPGPVFGPLNATASEDGALLSWEYFGQPRNIFVEYTVEHSKTHPDSGI